MYPVMSNVSAGQLTHKFELYYLYKLKETVTHEKSLPCSEHDEESEDEPALQHSSALELNVDTLTGQNHNFAVIW